MEGVICPTDVLITEDDGDITAAISAVIEEYGKAPNGYNIHTARTVREALDQLDILYRQRQGEAAEAAAAGEEPGRAQSIGRLVLFLGGHIPSGGAMSEDERYASLRDDPVVRGIEPSNPLKGSILVARYAISLFGVDPHFVLSSAHPGGFDGGQIYTEEERASDTASWVRLDKPLNNSNLAKAIDGSTVTPVTSYFQ